MGSGSMLANRYLSTRQVGHDGDALSGRAEVLRNAGGPARMSRASGRRRRSRSASGAASQSRDLLDLERPRSCICSGTSIGRQLHHQQVVPRTAKRRGARIGGARSLLSAVNDPTGDRPGRSGVDTPGPTLTRGDDSVRQCDASGGGAPAVQPPTISTSIGLFTRLHGWNSGRTEPEAPPPTWPASPNAPQVV
jgi:hypothetical protein